MSPGCAGFCQKPNILGARRVLVFFQILSVLTPQKRQNTIFELKNAYFSYVSELGLDHPKMSPGCAGFCQKLNIFQYRRVLVFFKKDSIGNSL